MTKRECAIVQAYTGYCMCSGDDSKFFYEYLKELYGRDVYTHEIPDLSKDIQDKAKDDFVSLAALSVDIDDVGDGLIEWLENNIYINDTQEKED